MEARIALLVEEQLREEQNNHNEEDDVFNPLCVSLHRYLCNVTVATILFGIIAISSIMLLASYGYCDDSNRILGAACPSQQMPGDGQMQGSTSAEINVDYADAAMTSRAKEEMQIFVRKMPDQDAVAIDVAADATIADVLTAAGLKHDDQLTHGGEPLRPSESLADIGIGAQSVLEVQIPGFQKMQFEATDEPKVTLIQARNSAKLQGTLKANSIVGFKIEGKVYVYLTSNTGVDVLKRERLEDCDAVIDTQKSKIIKIKHGKRRERRIVEFTPVDEYNIEFQFEAKHGGEKAVIHIRDEESTRRKWEKYS